MLAPRIANLCKDILGLIIMLDGVLTEEEKEQLSFIKLEVEKIKNPNLEQEYPLSFNILNAPVKYWIDLKKYDPINTLSFLNIPKDGRNFLIKKILLLNYTLN